ncbi:MAG: 2Fe-2S iron-sulfur cluster-binding protein [Polyangiaceae bacterium]
MGDSKVRNETKSFAFDGATIRAVEGESIASALVAAGHFAFARSPKFHRPRGPACFRAACDGCLARVDGVPNVMTCREPVRDGAIVESQNTLGVRDLDLLRMTDWFFPDGMNHHELFAGVPGVQSVMQSFARRVAGLGKLPRTTLPTRKAARETVDVLVVGTGPSGMAVANGIVTSGRKVLAVDDGFLRGGTLASVRKESLGEWGNVLASFDANVASGAVRLELRTTAAAFYGDDVLVVGPEGARVVTAAATVLASGAHDGVFPFEGNDLPGVMSARAALVLLANDAAPFREVALVSVDGGTSVGAMVRRAFAEAASTAPGRRVHVLEGAPVRASGIARVKRCRVKTATGEVDLDVDAVVIDMPPSPSYELASQTGARLAHESRGFVVKEDRGRIGPRLFATGELVGLPFEPGAVLAHAAATAAHVTETG